MLGIARGRVDTMESSQGFNPMLVLDIIIPHMDGLGVLEKLNHENMDKIPKVIILSAVGQDKVTQGL